jgi:Ca2+-binding RTX toxin-like protein
MTTYSFDTITAAQAAAFSGSDSLTFGSGTASAVTVLFNGVVTTLALGAHSVDFASAIANASQAGDISFPDHSLLYIGDAGANTEHLAIDSTTRAAMFGGDGNDVLITSLGGGLLQGNQGNDTLEAAGQATIYGGQGDDEIEAISSGSHDNFFQGNKGDDFIVGSNAGDTLLGGQGNDTILGNAGVDFINGNLGNDNLTGSGQLFGEDGNDTILGGSVGSNTILGGNGDDNLTGSSLSDPSGLLGAQNFISGDDGDDTIRSNSPLTDTLSGGNGNDTITTFNGGNDSLDGGAGDDNIQGGHGLADVITGGLGNDIIDGSGGTDTLSGGGGADRFIFGAVSTAAGSVAKIMDWSGSTDTLSFTGFTPNPSDLTTATAPDYATALSMATTDTTTTHFSFFEVQVGADVYVFAGGAGGPSSVVELVGRSLADFTGHNLG